MNGEWMCMQEVLDLISYTTLLTSDIDIIPCKLRFLISLLRLAPTMLCISTSISAVHKQCNYIIRRHILNALRQVTHMVSQDMLKQSLIFQYTLTSTDLTEVPFLYFFFILKQIDQKKEAPIAAASIKESQEKNKNRRRQQHGGQKELKY